jgi:hypothetical protein
LDRRQRDVQDGVVQTDEHETQTEDAQRPPATGIDAGVDIDGCPGDELRARATPGGARLDYDTLR